MSDLTEAERRAISAIDGMWEDSDGNWRTDQGRCGAAEAKRRALSRALEVARILAAPVEPAVAVDVTEKEEDDAVYLLGHRAGAEWMREQAALRADTFLCTRANVGACLGDLAAALRALPVSPPAPGEAK